MSLFGRRRRARGGPSAGRVASSARMAAAGLAARAEFEHLAEQDQRDDDRRGLEVGRDDAVLVRNPAGKKPGRERRDEAVDPRGAGAQGDEREHVGGAMTDGLSRADEERPAGPEHDRRGEQRGRSSCSLPSASVGTHAGDHAEPSRGRTPAASARARSRTAASCRAVRSRPPRRRCGIIGSSAMPHLGQAPGPSCTISGCIGQVYFAPGTTGAA